MRQALTTSRGVVESPRKISLSSFVAAVLLLVTCCVLALQLLSGVDHDTWGPTLADLRGLMDLTQLVWLCALALLLISQPRMRGPDGAVEDVDTRAAIVRWVRGLLPWLALVLLLGAVALARLQGDPFWPAMLFGAALACLGGVALTLVSAKSWSWLVPLLLLAASIRLIVAFGLHGLGLSIGPRAVVLDDESAFDLGARALLELFLQNGGELESRHRHLEGHYLSFVTFLYGMLGPNPLAARFAGVLAGVATVALGAATARTLFGRNAGLAAGLLLALLPSTILWSAMVLKEAFVSALLVLTLWAVVRWRRQPAWELAILVVALLHILSGLRLYVGLALGATIAVALGLWLLKRVTRPGVRSWAPTVAAVVVVGMAVLSWLAWPGLPGTLNPTTLLYLQTVSRHTPVPQFASEPGVEVTTRSYIVSTVVAVRDSATANQFPGMVVGYANPRAAAPQPPNEGSKKPLADYLVITREGQVVQAAAIDVRPIAEMDPAVALGHLADQGVDGLTTAVLAPLNTGMSSPRYVLLGLDALVWLGMLLLGIAGAVRSREPLLLIPLGFVAAVLVALAVVPGHPGNLVRHRAVLAFPALAIAAAPLLAGPLARLAVLWRELRLSTNLFKRLRLPEPPDSLLRVLTGLGK